VIDHLLLAMAHPLQNFKHGLFQDVGDHHRLAVRLEIGSINCQSDHSIARLSRST
jgi:hypothetical protein